MITLRYGQASEIRLELPPEARLGPARVGDDRPLSNVKAAARLAIQQPLGFPPLRQATVPGDQIVLAIEPDTPQAAELAAAVIEEILPAGGEPRNFTILCAQADVKAGLPDPRSRLPPEIAGAVQLAVHRPDDRGQLSYLGLTRGQQGVYLNRALCDADLVVPIGRTHGDQNTSVGLTAALYPTFSDSQALAGKALGGTAPRREATKPEPHVNSDEVAWMLGVQCLVLAVPGSEGGLCAVLAGTLDELRQHAPARHAAAWERRVEEKADLVVAAVPGGPAEQTWETISQALAAASSLAAEGGSIALCCELETPPSEALQLISQTDDPHDMLRKLRRAASPDLAVAARLVKVRESVRIYLLSRLDEAVVEELGLAAAADAEDIARLAARSRSCVALADAQHVIGVTQAGKRGS